MIRRFLLATSLFSASVFAQTLPAAGTPSAISATERLDADGDGQLDLAVVGKSAHEGFCALWGKQRETSNGLISTVATAVDLIDDTTPAVPATRQVAVRELFPLLDIYNGTVDGAHTPNFHNPFGVGCATPDAGTLSAERYAVRMRGNLHIEAPGTYTLVAVSDDGYQLKVGNTVVAAYASNRSPATDSRRMTFSAAGVYPVELIYWDQGGQSVMEVFWATGSICFNGSAQGTCGATDAGTFSDLSNVALIGSTPANFAPLSSDRVAPATWSTQEDRCLPYIGRPNTMCTPTTNACGNGLVEAYADGGAEGCDDGNTTAGDGCSATCTVETNFTCGTHQISNCVPLAPLITAPVTGSRTTLATPTLSGTGIVGASVNVRVDGVSVCTATVAAAGTWSCTSTALLDGAHTAIATQTDSGGRVSGNSNVVLFTVDTVAPGAPLITAPADASTTADSTPTVNGTGEVGATVRVFIDGNGTPACTAVVAINGTWACDVPTALTDGSHTVRASATDAAGNASPLSTQSTFTVDTTAPTAPMVSAPANGSSTNVTSPPVSGTGEAGSTVQVFFDGSTTAACTVTVSALGTWSCTPTSVLTEGAHTVTSNAIDAVGNVSVFSNTNGFRVDTTVPMAPVIATPANGSRTNVTTPPVSGTAEAGATVRVFFDGSTTVACTTVASATGAWACTPATALGEGTHAVRATATDVAGNTSPLSTANTFVIDATAPGAPVVTAPANGSRTNDTTPPVTGTAEAGSTVAVFFDGSTTAACTALASAGGTFSCTPGTALTDGSHTVRATATDLAGNTSPASSANTFTVDAAPPVAPVVIAPANGSRTNDTTPEVSGTAEANATVKVFFDGSTTAACTATASSSGAWSCTPTTALTEASHTVRASATDAAGNVSPLSTTSTFVIDTTAPSAPVVTGPVSGSTSADTTPTFSGTAEAGTTVTVFIDGSTTATCTTTASSTGAWSCEGATVLTDGAHAVTARATDVAGNASPLSGSVPFTIDSSGPVLPVVLAPSNGSASNDSTPTVSGTAKAGSTVAVFIDGSTTPACSTTASSTGTWSCDVAAALIDGTHRVSATSTEPAGAVAMSDINTFTIDTSAPATPVLLAPVASSTTSSTPTFSGTAEPGSTVSVKVDGTEVCTAMASNLGAFACVSTSVLTAGAHTATATASDTAGNASAPSASVPFTVATAVPPGPPVIAAPSAGSTTSDPTPTVSGSAEPGSTVRVFVDSSPTPACSATADATGHFTCDIAPALANGAHTVIATASNMSGTSLPSAPVHFSVNSNGAVTPVIVSPVANATTGTQPQVSGTAQPGSTVAVFIDGSTTAVCTATTSSSGLFACTPSIALTVGAHTVTAQSSDASGGTSPLSASVPFTVATGQPLAAPVITSPAANSTVSATQPTITGVASPGATVNVYVDSSATPACTTVADASGHFACAVSPALTEGAHTVTATASDASGTSASSTVVPFTVDTTAPMVPVVIAPTANESTGRQPTVTGTAEAGSTVLVRIDGQVVCQVVASAQGAWSCPVTQPLTPGAHSVTAAAVDAAGNASGQSTPVPFTVLAGPRVPVLDTPANGSNTVDTTPAFTGLAEPGSRVLVKVDGTEVCIAVADASGAFSCTPTTAIGLGMHSVVLESTSAGGNSTSMPSTFTIGNEAPAAPVITAPVNGSTTSDATPTITGTATPGSTVTVSIDAQTVCTATTDTGGNWSCDVATPLSAQGHTATATQTTVDGTSAPSSPVQFNVTATAPIITSPKPGEEAGSQPTFTGTAQPGSTVSIIIGGTVVCTTTAGDDGSFSCTPSQPLPTGDVTVTARSVDDLGIERVSDSLTFRVTAYKLGGAGLIACNASGQGAGLMFLLAALIGRRRKK